MKRLSVCLLVLIAAASLALAGCTQAAPTPAPTAAPAAPTKPAAAPTAAPTKPAAAAPTAVPPRAPTAPPTAAPATKVGYPTKGKTMTMIVSFAAGSATDIIGRLLGSFIEKDLGVPVQVVNKPGASGQVGVTDLALSKPDGYTISIAVIPLTSVAYLLPERKAAFTRGSLQTVALHSVDPVVFAVSAESPYKTLKDLMDAARANTEKLKMASAGMFGTGHLATLKLEQMTGARFAHVHFDGGAPAATALVGGHADVANPTLATFTAQVKSGAVRFLGVMDPKRSKFFPDVPTFEEQGYKVNMNTSQGVIAPAGIPREVLDILSKSIQKAMTNTEYIAKMNELALELSYMDPDRYSAYWDEVEAQVKPLLALATK